MQDIERDITMIYLYTKYHADLFGFNFLKFEYFCFSYFFSIIFFNILNNFFFLNFLEVPNLDVSKK